MNHDLSGLTVADSTYLMKQVGADRPWIFGPQAV